jgi:aryl-alcohol dehydrogenase-like predicted oxidoreductase
MLSSRPLGTTGLSTTPLAFGCGNVGGLFTTDDHTDAQQEALQRAWDLGVNWFDTAPQYGMGRSERNLGASLRQAGLEDEAVVSTKVRVTEDDLRGDIRSAIMRSVEASLERLGTDHVGVFQLHNRVTEVRGTQPDALSIFDVLGEDGVLETLERLRGEGLCRAIGMTALGDTEALRIVVQGSGFQTAQVYYNLLNPTAADKRPGSFPVHDYGQLLDLMAMRKMGVLAIRVLAAGALTSEPPSAPRGGTALSAGSEFQYDVERAAALAPLAREYETTVSKAALRFVLHDERVTGALIGVSDAGQVEEAVEAFEDGPLPGDFFRQWRSLLESDFGRNPREGEAD